MKQAFVIMTDTICQGNIIGCWAEDATGKRVPSTYDTEVAAWKEDGKIIYDAEAGSNDVWSVYLRMDMTIEEDNPLRCIADFETVEQALIFEKLVRLLLKLDV